MKKFPLQKIKASDGCVIYFPSRKSNKIIFGADWTRRRFREEWIQIRLSHIEDEVHFEGNNALTMGDVLQAELVAKIITRISDEDLEGSIPKIIEKFRCSTTTDLNVILGNAFFQPKISELFKESLFTVIRKASYKRLLTDTTHRDILQQELIESITPVLNASGFRLIDCSIKRFIPLNPGVAGVEKEIVEKWIEWEKQEALLEAEKEFLKSEIEEEKRRKAAIAREKTDRDFREIELRELESKKLFEEEKSKIEIKEACNRKEKERQIAKINEEIKEIHRKYQETEIAFKNKIEEDEIDRKNKIEEEEVTFKNKMEQSKLNHEADIRKKQINALSEELRQYKLKEQITEIATKVKRLEGLLEAELLEAKIKAQGTSQRELLEAESKIWKDILGQLSPILEKSPVEKIGPTTLIQFATNEEVSKGLNWTSLAYWPLIKDFISIISQHLSKVKPTESGQE
ncbi:MAG: hypothetical protein AB1422_05175 [bacterium]